MPEPYIGEIRMFGGNFPPVGWLFCAGQQLAISENDALFTLIGTTYGGDGQETFNLPNLQSRIPVHMGTLNNTPYPISQMAGTEQETLTVQQIPSHTHPFTASTANGTSTNPGDLMLAASVSSVQELVDGAGSVPMAANSITPVGGASRTRTRSRSSASISSSRSSGYSRPRPKEKKKKMSDPFVAEIRIFPFNFPPKGWAFCNGQLMPISQNTALFALLGTTYGGDGKSTFALPDLQGSAPMQPGQGQGLSLRDLGQIGGSETITLLVSEIPVHTHFVETDPFQGDKTVPGPDKVLAVSLGGNVYASGSPPLVNMAFQSLPPAGGSLPHNNMQPYLALNFCIALQGVFPQRP